jgi:hypothetical protein
VIAITIRNSLVIHWFASHFLPKCNKMRAHHYATAVNYLKLAEAEAKSAPRPDGVLSSRLQALVQLSRPVSGFPQNLGKSV